MASTHGISTVGQPARSLPAARAAARSWAAVPLSRRLETIRSARRLIAERVESLAAVVEADFRRSSAETVSAEILPLADACRFLEREAATILRDRPLGRAGRPPWLSGVRSVVQREPLGVVLIIGPFNYPLMIPGIQAMQALAAGNAVLLKPGRGGRAAALALQRLLFDAGLPEDLLTVLDERTTTAREALRAGADHVVLTGSAGTGREVLEQLAPQLIPSTMELSGSDAVFVLEDADLELVERALRFGMTFNGGFTCVAPRRLFVARNLAKEVEERLERILKDAPAVSIGEPPPGLFSTVLDDALRRGARWVVGGPPSELREMRPSVLAGVAPECRLLTEEIAVPLLALVPVDSLEQAVELAARSPYALGATIFGSPKAARALAAQIDVGTICINDMIAPTADPRIPFGGKGESGFGVTRGAEGLTAMTRPKTILENRSRSRRHFDPIGPLAERVLPALVRLTHGKGIGTRIRALIEIAKAGRNDSRGEKS